MDAPKTVAEMIKFHTYLGEKGLMNERTAYARVQAAQQVLSVLDPHEKADLSSVDRELTFKRFVNKQGQRFTPESLQTYRHRFNSALDEFLSYSSDPSKYKPPVSPRERTRPANAENSSSLRSATRTPRQVDAQIPPGLLAYPLPLPSGAVAQLLLPPSITQADADRIKSLVAAMVGALTVKEAPQ